MSERVDVTDVFSRIMADAMSYVTTRHGTESAHRLFFELYSHTFDYLEREHGFEAVKAFWEYIADHELAPLENLMRAKGFDGMHEYWSAVADQEGADIQMKKTADSFSLVVRHCPPTEWFKQNGLPHYPRYHEHCATLYERIANRCGFDMMYAPPDEKAGTCCGLHFTRKKNK